MALVLTTSAEILRWAGSGASSTITSSGALVTTIGENAEKRVCAETRKDWIGGVSSIDSNTSALVSKACALAGALEIANYSRTNYFSRAEQQQILSVIYDEYKRAIEILREMDANSIKSI